MKPWLLACLVLLCTGVLVADTFLADLQSFRQARDAELRKPDGWLTLAGLFWLHPGDNPAGSDSGNEVVFPPGSPAHLGTFHLAADGTVTLTADPAAGVMSGGQPIHTLTLAPADPEGHIKMAVGSLSWYIIRRDGRVAIRLKDSNSPVLAGFHGVEVFAPAPQWQLPARFEPLTPPLKRPAPTALGTETTVTVVGHVAFEADGRTFHLEATREQGDTELSIIFADATSGHGTYPAGRYLDVPLPGADGHLVLDFNRAYNPPCAFTHFATCVYPRHENRLPLAITAGEKYTPH